MVKLTTKYLFRKLSRKNQLQPRRKNESDLDYLNRMTHLHLQSQFIDNIALIPQCHAVTVVYLQNNLLQSIHNLNNFPNLTHLYLQHNYITKIENLSKLKYLRKLYLGYNEISVIEGLEDLTKLTELHIESQRLPQGETLYFDPRSVRQLERSLQVLNISKNNVSSLSCVADLASLKRLIVEDNKIRDMEDIMETLSYLPRLEILNCEGNPVANDRKFLDAVVLSSKSIKTLNGKDIDEKTRTFIKNLSHNKELRRRMSEDSTKDSNDEWVRSQGDIASKFQNIPYHAMGSKLFPILKEVAQANPRVQNVPSSASAQKQLSLLNSSINISRLTL